MKPSLPTKRSLTRRLKPAGETSRVLKFGIKGIIATRSTWADRLNGGIAEPSNLIRMRKATRQ